MIILYIILGILAVLFLYMLIVTISKKPNVLDKAEVKLAEVDKNVSAAHLSGAVKCATVSLNERNSNDKPFYEFHAFLDKTYPLFTKTAEKKMFSKYSLMYFIKGSDANLKPACFLSHQDVVPAPSEGWEVPPFSGAIKDGYVYGRGSQDMKSQLTSSLDAIELMLSQGFKPKRGIYFCFGHDEEVTTKQGAPIMAKYFLDNNIELEFVYDEGGAILDGGLLGIKGKKLGMIGTCEKGYCDFKITAEVPGGHASAPGKKTAMGELSKALIKLEKNPMPAKWTETSKAMFDALAPHMNPLFKFFFTNRRILSPLLRWLMTIITPITNSLFRTTFAPTMCEGSGASNVLPPSASAIVNVRIITGETAEEVKAYMQKVVGKDIKVEIISANDPTPVSSVNTDTYKILEKTLMESFDDMIPAPFLFIAATDARYYTDVCKNVYRMTPFMYTEDDQARIHAINERCNIDDLAKAVQFFVRFIENICG
jgi:carboxypeptidase PM20D1